jgi:hypothetical protein
MTTNQESKLNMYLAVRNFVISNEGSTKDLPNFSANYTTLLNLIGQIQSISEIQKSDLKGLAIEKNKLREALIANAEDYSRKITAYARFNSNEPLLNEARFSTSDLIRMTDVSLKDYLQIIYDKAEANLASLAEYGISAETQTKLKETITAYDTSLSKPRTGIAEKSKATKKLTELFDSADSILENMDYSVGIVKLTQKDFFNAYKSVRKCVSTYSGCVSLKATVTDQVTGEPVKGVVFTLKANGTKMSGAGGNGEIRKKSASKGHFMIKNMPAGTYSVLLSKPGYKDKEVTVSIADNEMSELKVEIEKI